MRLEISNKEERKKKSFKNKVKLRLKTIKLRLIPKSYRVNHHPQPNGFIVPNALLHMMLSYNANIQRQCFIGALHAASQRLILEILINKCCNKQSHTFLLLTVWSIEQQQQHTLGAHEECPISDLLYHTQLFNKSPERVLYIHLYTQETLRSFGPRSHALLFILIIYSQ